MYAFVGNEPVGKVDVLGRSPVVSAYEHVVGSLRKLEDDYSNYIFWNVFNMNDYFMEIAECGK